MEANRTAGCRRFTIITYKYIYAKSVSFIDINWYIFFNLYRGLIEKNQFALVNIQFARPSVLHYGISSLRLYWKG